MSYIKVALNRNRILNHIELINEKRLILSNFSSEEISCGAGHIELQLTDKCVLNCSNCHFRGLGDQEFSFEWLEKVVNFIKPKAITIAGGGEPTIYPRFNEAILKLSEIPNVKIGLITNGVVFPEGSWVEYISWVRISVYSIERSKYAGRNSQIKKIVINNIQRYLFNTDIANVGIHFLFYKNNVKDILPFTKEMYNRFGKYKKESKKIHIQFKPAFLMVRPSMLTNKKHKENIKLLPNIKQIKTMLGKFKNEFSEDPDFEDFVHEKTNYELFNRLVEGYLEELIEMTNPFRIDFKKIKKCYVCLAFQLIAPDGYIYPCLTLAEHRLKEFSICHISNLPDYPKKIIKNFYVANTECCNNKFCRNWDQNEIVESFFRKPKKINISDDMFF